MAITDNIQQKIQQAQEAGYTPDQIQTFLKSKGIAAPTITPVEQPKGFIQNVGADLQKRGANLDASLSSNQHPAVKGLDIVGQGAGFVTDVAGEAVKAIPGVKTAIASLLETPIGQLGVHALQAGGELWGSFQKAHPEAAQILGDVGNIAALVPIGGGAKVGARVAGDVAGEVAGGTLRGVGGVLKTSGEKLTGVGIGMAEPTKIALQAYQATKPTLLERVQGLFGGDVPTPGNKPITEANTAVRLLTPGTEWQLGVNAKKVAGSLWDNTIAPALDSTKEKVDMRGFLSDLKTQIIADTPDLTRRASLLKGLESMQADYSKVGQVSLKKLQDYKAGWAKFLPQKAFKGEEVSGAANEVRNLAAQKARSIIYSKLGTEVRQAYFDYGNLQSIQDAGIKSIDALRSKGVTKQVWEAIMDTAVTPITTIAGKVLYRTGQGLEFIGNVGAKKVRDVIGPSAAIPKSNTANP